MAPPLIIRNLTPVPITLKKLETFEDPNTKQSKASAFPAGWNGTTALAPSAPKLGAHSQTFSHQELDICLAPFESYTLRPGHADTPSKDTSTVSATTLRLTIESAGGKEPGGKERHRIDANPSYTRKSSHTFTPLTPNPWTSYTALYHPAQPTAHLTIHANHKYNYAKWMQDLPSTLPLSALSIPGTHNSHTYYRALPSVRCQIASVKKQIENGVRFLDIRVQPANASDTSIKNLYLVHGAFPVSLTGVKYLAPILEACYKFLDDNPSEVILISLKREGIGSSTDEHLADILMKHYITPNKSKWYIDDTIPYLGSVRGKIVLVRRYNIDPASPITQQPQGLDGTAWPHSLSHATHGPFSVQDWCEVLHPASIPTKLQYSIEHLIRTSQTTAFIPGVNTDKTNPVPPGPLHLNFLTGNNFWRTGTWPGSIAKVVNRGVEEWICMRHALEEPGVSRESGETGIRRMAPGGDGSTGVVVIDMLGEGEDWDLAKMIVGMNMGVLLRMEEFGQDNGK